jgi:hypothetical protein
MRCRDVAHEWRPDVITEQLLEARRHLADKFAWHAEEEILLSPGPRLAVLV